jgi:D-serine deaminase-like pyridoxal phosphate-dependent protein
MVRPPKLVILKTPVESGNIHSPTLIVNEQICRSNIHWMAEKASSNKLIFRPHFKTHQSVEIGEWFRAEGVSAITVSSVSMAHKFADAGWGDITIAFPLNIREIDEINQLAGKISLNILIDMPEQISALSTSLKHPVGFYIKIDLGYHRAGIEPANTELIERIIGYSKSGQLTFKGFLTHSGNTYQASGKQEIFAIHESAALELSKLKRKYQSEYPGIIVSCGDTPSCSLAEDFSEIDEIRPGNFVFYDLMQLRIGSCKFNEIAAAVVCPVVSVYPKRNEALIYGGAVHLSKEAIINADGSRNYGLVVPFVDGRWQSPMGDDWLVSLSQEHGIFKTESTWAKSLSAGDLVAVIPVHSCLSADLLRSR